MPVIKVTLHWDTGEIVELGMDDRWLAVGVKNGDAGQDLVRAIRGDHRDLCYLYRVLGLAMDSAIEDQLGWSRPTLDRNPPPPEESIEA